MARRKSGFQFEKALTELESIVNRIEAGELSLEESLAAFEQGVQLTRDCQKALDEAEQKVEMLSADAPDETDDRDEGDVEDELPHEDDPF